MTPNSYLDELFDTNYKLKFIRRNMRTPEFDDWVDNFLVTSSFKIKRVIFNNPATIILWEDGTKTVVKCGKDDVYNKETGIALCFMKKALGNKGSYNNIFKEWIKEDK